jgi:hypothetical protein
VSPNAVTIGTDQIALCDFGQDDLLSRTALDENTDVRLFFLTGSVVEVEDVMRKAQPALRTRSVGFQSANESLGKQYAWSAALILANASPTP